MEESWSTISRKLKKTNQNTPIYHKSVSNSSPPKPNRLPIRCSNQPKIDKILISLLFSRHTKSNSSSSKMLAVLSIKSSWSLNILKKHWKIRSFSTASRTNYLTSSNWSIWWTVCLPLWFTFRWARSDMKMSNHPVYSFSSKKIDWTTNWTIFSFIPVVTSIKDYLLIKTVKKCTFLQNCFLISSIVNTNILS